MYFIIFGAVLLFGFAVYLFFTWNNNYWKKHGIPHEEPKFFFGNFKEALTGQKHYGLIYCDLYKKFNDAAYFGFYKLRTPTLVLRDLDLIKDVMVKDFNCFAANDFHVDKEQDPILAANPFALTGEEWKIKRMQWTTGMTASRVKLIYPGMLDSSDVMVKYLQTHVAERPGEPLEARELALKYLTDVIVTSVLGLQLNSFEDDKNIFKKIATSIFVSDFWEGLLNLSYMIAPWIHTFFKIRFIKKEYEKELLNIARNIIAIRKENGFVKNDFFEILMKGDKVDELEVAGRAFGFLSDGVETSSGLISFTLFELASNPHIQSRLREELEKAAATNDGQLTFEHITTMPYLEMITLEVLRMHPPVFTINRVCTRPFTLPPAGGGGGGAPFTVPVGMAVTVPSYAPQVDPRYFPQPELFLPDRFAEGASGGAPKYAFMPFGEGPRICVGMRLGMATTKTCIAHIVRNFELRVASRTKPGPLEVDPNVIVNRAVGEIWLSFHKLRKETD